MVDIDTAQLSPAVVSLGKLLGLLTDNGTGSVQFNTDWFEHPLTYLEAIPNNLSDAVEIVNSLLTLSTANPPVFSDAQWYQIPNIVSGMGTPFYIVLPKNNDTSGEIGIGILSAGGGTTVVDVYFYIPLFSFGTSGVEFIADSLDHPTQLGLNAIAPSGEPFAVIDNSSTVTFTEFDVLVDFFLADVVPTGQVTFQSLTGTSEPSTYTTFSSLLNTTVVSWIAEVVLQSSGWLNVYAGSNPYTIGDFLEAANFLSRSYLISADNLPEVSTLVSILNAHTDAVTQFIWGLFPTADQQIIANSSSTPAQLTDALVDALNTVVQNGKSIYDPTRFASVVLSPETDAWVTRNPQDAPGLIHLNRLLLEDAYKTFIMPNDFALNLQNVQGTGMQIALNFVFAILDLLAQLEIPVIFLPQGGIYIVERTNADNSSDYGLRFAFQLSLDSSPNQSGQPPSPEVDLCLGTWMTNETDTDNWYIDTTNGAGAERGLSLFGLHRASDGTLSFAPSFEMVSLGINIQGGGNSPLIDLQGYSLGGVELRFSLDQVDWAYGLAARVDSIGFPLAPPFNQTSGGSGNLIAQNLLAGDNNSSNSADPNQTSATNPTFSAQVSYVKGYSPLLEIYDSQGQKTDLIWFPIQRRFGPLDVNKIGLRIDVTGQYASDPLLGLVFDGGVTLAGLALSVDQLEIDMLIKQITQASGYSFDLHGLSVYFNEGGIEIGGGLIKNTANSPVSYDGEAIIKIEDFGITALGSYSSLPDGSGTSLFVFVLINAPIGGPGFFYVTGLAFGFGYNRSLVIPTQSQISTFPLVSGLTDPSQLGNTLDLTAVLQTFDKWVPPERGEYWVAAGIQFTTYEIINTNALLIVQFGNKFTIALIGIAILKQLPLGETYVYAELDIEVVFDPGAGEFLASASLAPNSYVLDPNAHLTGGFAFYAWFGSNAHAGDFVFTLGGYHPAFVVPDYYPKENRIGVNWKVSDNLTMSGGVYFAITPTAMMAGASVSFVFQAGALKAWLQASLDAILYFKPFYMDVMISISIGVSYRLHVAFVDITFSVELGASLHLWGPQVGGTVHVSWYIISFTIGFGADPNPPSTLAWDDFKGLLPSKTTTDNSAQAMMLTSAAPQDNTTSTPSYLNINANAGMMSSQQVENMTFWLVRAGEFTFTAGSAIPASTIVITDGATIGGTQVGVQRLNGGIAPSDYASTQTITVLNMTNEDLTTVDQFVQAVTACMASGSTNVPSGCTNSPINMSNWTATPVVQNLPQAIYGDPTQNTSGLNPNPSSPTVSATTGVRLFPTPPIPTNGTPELFIDEIFEGRTLNPQQEAIMPLSQTITPTIPSIVEADSFLDVANVNTTSVATERNAVFFALQAMGVNGWTNDPLPQMASTPGQDFADEPLEGSLVVVS